MLLTAGERISMALLAMAIKNLGHEAQSLHRQPGRRHHRLGPQQGADHRRHPGPDPYRARRGQHRDRRRVPGRLPGQARTSPPWAAAAPTPPPSRWPPRSSAEVCEIYTDVDGVFTADPRVVKKARKIDWIAFEDMLELAASGSKVLLHRCVEYARRYNIPIHVRSSFSGLRGHLGQHTNQPEGDRRWSRPSSPGSPTTRPRPRSRSSACRTSRARPRAIFRAIADAEINIDMVVQNVSAAVHRPDRHLLHPAEGRGPQGHRRAGAGQGGHRLRVAALRRPDRQDLAGRRGHEVQPGGHRDLLRGARPTPASTSS